MSIKLSPNLELLHEYSESNPFGIQGDFQNLFNELNKLKEELNFPAVTHDVGKFLNFLASQRSIEVIFEFGSGYGQSAFWFLMNNPHIKKIYLTEKRDDLITKFESLSFSKEDFSRMDYFQGDAFKRLEEVENIDLLLLDGVKKDYITFLKNSLDKLSENALVFIDNAFWRGSFLDPELVAKKESTKGIYDLHEYLKTQTLFDASFLPFKDGGILLRKLSK